MAILKCKMCGGDLEVIEGTSFCTCLFCGTQQTVPTVNDEILQPLFNRANVLRMKSEFDKAADIYEKILQKNETEAEAYWGLILCKYGIEYVEDPKTYKRVPTCHRTSYDAVISDEDYRNAIKYADTAQRRIYEAEAAAIDEIQKNIIAIANREDPYDIFICYKEADSSGKRTHDSVIANDIYHHLTQEGFKVFYAAITLEDKLGTEYEPYIFSALNTAKVMLVIGTKPEYFNAVWVKNEWSRFLKIMKKDHSKLLIPCYLNMDPYELPEEFAHLQAQNMSKIGFINDIVRGIKKVIKKEEQNASVNETVIVQPGSGGTTVQAQILRGNMALEDREWDKADQFFEEALNLDPQCAEAYIGKLLVRDKKSGLDAWLTAQKVKYSSFTTKRLEACPDKTEHISQIRKTVFDMEFEKYFNMTNMTIVKKLYEFDRGYNSALSCRIEQRKQQLSELSSDRLLKRAKQYAKGETAEQLENAFFKINDILDKRISEAQEQDKKNIDRVTNAYAEHIAAADKKIEEMKQQVQDRQEKSYQSALALMKNANDISDYRKIRDALHAMKEYKDSKEYAAKCQAEIDRLIEEKRLEQERQAAIQKEEAERTAKKKKKNTIIITSIITTILVLCFTAFLLNVKVIIPNQKYNAAVSLMEDGDFENAIAAFKALDGYKDSNELADALLSEYLEAKKAEYQNAKIGESIVLGLYEQDNDISNGKEDIEWIVLDKDEEKMLIISKYALDCHDSYFSERTFWTWEACSLREWLNESFVETAFDTEERTHILTTNVTADNNPEYEINAGNDTQDQIFLLSITEIEKYFSNNDDRRCIPTAYAIAQGAEISEENSVDGTSACKWWIRTPGYRNLYATDVAFDGSVNCYGTNVKYEKNCVRPALWISLKSD